MGTDIVSSSSVLVVVLSIIFILGLFAAIALMFLFWILMIIDAAKREFKDPNERVVWVLILVFLQILGAVIYYFIIKRPAKQKDKPA